MTDYDGLTLENFAERTGRKRFRMTKDQKDRQISREKALEEWIAEQQAGPTARPKPAPRASRTITFEITIPKGSEEDFPDQLQIEQDDQFWGWIGVFQDRYPDVPNKDQLIIKHLLDLGVGAMVEAMPTTEAIEGYIAHEQEVLENRKSH